MWFEDFYYVFMSDICGSDIYIIVFTLLLFIIDVSISQIVHFGYSSIYSCSLLIIIQTVYFRLVYIIYNRSVSIKYYYSGWFICQSKNFSELGFEKQY